MCLFPLGWVLPFLNQCLVITIIIIIIIIIIIMIIIITTPPSSPTCSLSLFHCFAFPLLWPVASRSFCAANATIACLWVNAYRAMSSRRPSIELALGLCSYAWRWSPWMFLDDHPKKSINPFWTNIQVVKVAYRWLFNVRFKVSSRSFSSEE